MKSACKFGLMSFSEYDRRYKQHEREQKYRIVRREHLHPSYGKTKMAPTDGTGDDCTLKMRG